MGENLFVVCMSSFVSVFAVLTFLAIVMRLLTAVFPEKTKGGVDGPLLAAIHSAFAVVKPGTKVTKIEEVKRR